MASAASAKAQFGVPLNRTDPRSEPVAVRELVASYCRLDYAGARLNPSEWAKLQPLVAWRTNPDFPLIMVTSRFDVDPEPIPQRGKYLVTVHYRLVGKYDIAGGYLRESANPVQNVQFVVSEVNGEWRITEADPDYPHPSRAVALQWLQTKLADTQDPSSKTMFQHAIQELQPQPASTPAP
jgi:hypothetical protein